MSEKLILISVGPVQEFIASARKLRDMWFGSYFLSEVSKVVAKSLSDSGCTLIFPSVQNISDLNPNSELIVANKILAKCRAENSPNEIIAKARKAWRESIELYASETLESLQKDFKSLSINTEMYQKQVADLGEFFGVYTEIGNNYKEARSRVEKLLGGRKSLREFNPPTWEGSGIAKNSLDGFRESVIPSDTYIKGFLKRNEKLDAIGCIKRFHPLRKKSHFDSLADIAVKPWFSAMSNNSIFTIEKENFERALGLKSQNISAELYFANQKTLQEEAETEEHGRLAFNVLKKMYTKEFVGEPQKYACVLLGDGDKVGAAIDEITSEEGHKIFSRHLSQFAIEAKKIVEANEGSLVYAGGDDILAYAPIHTALTCADQLRLAFHKIMEATKKEMHFAADLPTLSIGMVIVHHQEPLTNVFALVRNAESIAKEKGGRNALAIIQDKRSGSPISIVGKWDEANQLQGMVKRLQEIIALYENPDAKLHMSSGLGYQLRSAAKEAGDHLDYALLNGKLIPKNAQSALVQRIFKQKDKDNKAGILNILSGRTSIKQLSNELVVANQFKTFPKGELK